MGDVDDLGTTRSCCLITRTGNNATVGSTEFEISLLKGKICSADRDCDAVPFLGTDLLLKLIKVPHR